MNYRRAHLRPKLRKFSPPKTFFKRVSFQFLLGTVALAGVAYYLVFSSQFQVHALEISGNQSIPTEDIEEFAKTFTSLVILKTRIMTISTKSIFFINAPKISREISLRFPKVERAAVKKKLFQTLLIEIKEREQAAVYCQAENCYAIDATGFIFEKSANISGAYVVITKEGQWGNELVLGKQLLPEKTIQGILKIQNALGENFQISATKATAGEDLVIETSEGWKAYFDPTADILLQIQKMQALLRNEISEPARKKMKYLYLQYKDRAYYK